MKYQLNVLAAFILIVVSLLIAAVGVIAIDQVTRELNSRLLTHEVENLIDDIDDTRMVLKENRVENIESYVERAKRDLLDEFNTYSFGQTGQLLVYDVTMGTSLLQKEGAVLKSLCIDSLIRNRAGIELCGSGSERYLVNFATVEAWQWLVAVSVAEAEIMAARDRFLWSVGCILFISMIGGIFIFIWFTGKIIQPIKQLTAAAASVAKGKWDAPLPKISGDNEIAELSNIFQKMSSNLAESYTKLQENIQDIATSREDLRLSREQFRGLVETSSDLVWEVDVSGVYTYVSPRVEIMLGYSPESVIGQSHSFLDVEDEKGNFRYGELLLTDMPFSNVERCVKTASGDSKVLESSGRPFFDGSGRRLGFRGIDRDITERKVAVQMQQELQDQLIQAQKMESIGRLAGGVAHDYNNMLGVIMGNVDLAMEDQSIPPAAAPYFCEIQKAAERSARITKQLLAFARKQTVSPEKLDLNSAVGELLKMLRRLIGEDVTLLWQPGEQIWNIKLDASQLDQIMVNLCVNSRDAIKSNGTITIRTENIELDENFCLHHNNIDPGRYVKLEVEDTGKGIEKELLEHIFEPFFTTKEMGKGTGLGLATVYGIVQQNGGLIDVWSRLGEGTCFVIYFPALRYDEKSQDVQTGTMDTRPGKGTILLVEDEGQVLKMTSRMLSSLGYEVFEAQTSADALLYAQTRGDDIDLLVTDVVMPDMNGHDLMKEVCSVNNHIHCLFISGYPADVIAHHGILDEGVHFLQKPFTRESLSIKISKIIKKKENQ